MQVFFTPLSRRDLMEIERWIAGDSETAADKMIQRLVDAGQSLATLSARYPLHPKVGLRKRPVDPYIVFYRIGERVEIVRILHSARDWVSLLDDLN